MSARHQLEGVKGNGTFRNKVHGVRVVYQLFDLGFNPVLTSFLTGMWLVLPANTRY